MRDIWLGLADGVIALHYAFVAYVLLGGFLAWRRPRTIVLHLAAVGWALAGVITPLACPLTAAQNWLYARAGRAELRGGFISNYLRGTFYPAHDERWAQLAVAAVIALSWAGWLRRHRREHAVRRRDSTEVRLTQRRA